MARRSLWGMKMKPMMTMLLGLLLAGCSGKPAPSDVPPEPRKDPLTARFERIEDGMSREQVRERMAVPETRRDATLPEGPFWGPQEGLEKVIPPQTSFEEWVYTNATHVFLVWFWSTNEGPRDTWTVIGRTRHEHDVDW